MRRARTRITEALITLLSDLLQFNGSRHRSKVTRTMTKTHSPICKLTRRRRTLGSQASFLMHDAAWIYIFRMRNMCVRWDETFFSCHPPSRLRGHLFTYRIAAHARGISMSWLHVYTEAKCPRRLFCLDHTRTGLLIWNWERANVEKVMHVWHHLVFGRVMYLEPCKKALKLMWIVNSWWLILRNKPCALRVDA
jgi:hypothetical protein